MYRAPLATVPDSPNFIHNLPCTATHAQAETTSIKHRFGDLKAQITLIMIGNFFLRSYVHQKANADQISLLFLGTTLHENSPPMPPSSPEGNLPWRTLAMSVRLTPVRKALLSSNAKSGLLLVVVPTTRATPVYVETLTIVILSH
jgi:hypothetical protein